MMREELLKELTDYLENNLKQTNSLSDKAKSFMLDNRIADNVANLAMLLSNFKNVSSSKNFNSDANDEEDLQFNLEGWIEAQRRDYENFRELLLGFLKEKGYDKDSYPTFYNGIFMDRRMFSRLISEKYQGVPEKSTIFKFIIGLELDLPSANKLLESAGHCFNHYRELDMIIMFCVENSIFDIDTVDELLCNFNEKALFSLE